jgi:hypothetical protein
MNLVRLLPLVIALSSPLAAQSAPRVTGTLPAAELTALERIRHDVWVHWFSGDTAALRRVLGPELVAISPDVAHWQSLEQSLAGSARFKSGGGRLISVSFDSTAIHRFGEVVVMFSHYAVVTEHSGSRATQKGRATELFVRQAGKWVHTSWHLDVVP